MSSFFRFLFLYDTVFVIRLQFGMSFLFFVFRLLGYFITYPLVNIFPNLFVVVGIFTAAAGAVTADVKDALEPVSYFFNGGLGGFQRLTGFALVDGNLDFEFLTFFGDFASGHFCLSCNLSLFFTLVGFIG